MNPCHLLIRVFGWKTMANLPSSPILYFFSLQKMIFLFLLCVWFCSYSRSWPPCPCHWPHPDRYHWLGSPPSPHLPSLQPFNLLPHLPHVSYFFTLYLFIFRHFFSPLIAPSHLPSFRPFINLPTPTCVLFCSPYIKYLFHNLSFYNRLGLTHLLTFQFATGVFLLYFHFNSFNCLF